MKWFDDVNKNKEAVEELYYRVNDEFEGYKECDEAFKALTDYLEHNNFFPNVGLRPSQRECDIDELTGQVWTSCEKLGFIMGFNIAIKLLGLEIENINKANMAAEF